MTVATTKTGREINISGTQIFNILIMILISISGYMLISSIGKLDRTVNKVENVMIEISTLKTTVQNNKDNIQELKQTDRLLLDNINKISERTLRRR